MDKESAKKVSRELKMQLQNKKMCSAREDDPKDLTLCYFRAVRKRRFAVRIKECAFICLSLTFSSIFSGSSLPTRRSFLVRLPNGNFGIVEKPMSGTPAPAPLKVEAVDNSLVESAEFEDVNNPFKAEDEEFMKEGE